MRKIILTVFLAVILMSGLFATDNTTNYDEKNLEEVSLEQINEDAVILEVGDGYTLYYYNGKYYLVIW
ncbi:MAG: hypothetical protein SVM86_04525 [Candidatus Cloacimonadota bacterium]|nr:hypothetical protein [Candidatus Cloacimonadota bacterium]